MPDKYPRPFGRYTLLAPLAQGGMGALYLACVGDRGLEKLCVIKTVLPHLADPEYVSRFRDEAKVVVKLSHGNLVPVFDAGLVQDELYLAMDYIEGKDLRAVWNRCAKKGIAFPIDVAVYIARELARGLHYAHNFGGIKLVHRDVSPPNVLVGVSGEVKLTDFGLASSTLKLEKTAAGIIYGKVSYMSPEQARGELIDGRTDIYAAGIILWELLTGRQLFPQNQSDGTELIERVRNPVIDPPSVRAPRVPAALDQIVLRALAKNTDERYATGEQFRADLTAFLASNRDYVATDSERVRAFMKDLFDEDIERERRQRDELLETVHDKLQENQRLELAEREAAEQRQQRKADIIAAIERKGDGESTAAEGGLREGEIPGQVIDRLSAYDTGKMIGSIIERWKILSKIGEGGMGRVFEAEHTEIGRRVAIKILHPVYSRTPEVVARFRMEARAASRIGHPNIIEVTDSGTTIDGSFYFVMELLEGVDLAERLKKEKQLPVIDALTVATQVAQALGAAHQINIVHRDLKPENIFLINRDGNPNFVKVLDFGIAKSLEEEKIRKLTTPGMAMGTPEYMAPEQASGKGSDARSDIYSLGAILYEMLAGKTPIDGDNMMEILIRKATKDPVDIAALRPDLPQAVAQLCMRTLSRSPEGRPQSMGELAQEINQLLADLHAGIVPVPKVPSRPRDAAGDAANQQRSEQSGPTPGDEQGHRRRLLIGGVIGSGGLVGIGISLYLVLFPTTTLPPRHADMAVDQAASVRVVPPPPAPHDAGTNGTAVVVAPKPDMASTHTSEPSTGPSSSKGMLYRKIKMPPPINQSDALAKIEEGKLKIGTGRPDIGWAMCLSAAGNPQIRGLAFFCMGEAEFARNRVGEAVNFGKLALKDKGPSKDTYLLLGKAYLKLKDCKNAKIYWQRVLNTDSANPEALAGMSKCP